MTDSTKRVVAVGLAMVAVLCRWTSGEEFLKTLDLRVLDRPANTMMSDYLTAIVDEQFAKRASLLAGLRTAEDWDRHAAFIRDSMAEWTGPLPGRTPLRARVTGRIERHEYTMEKILFESRPNFLVSANLYLPKGRSGPRPAVLNVIGHSPAGKATDKVQQRAIAQARKGFVALVVDCIGQGERQVEDYAHIHSPPGNAHQIIGTQAFVAGTHVFNFMVWDAIRAVDYLVSRPEVDPTRIACTGCSGGGMMTTYILAFEPRIAVAVPACNPCTWSHRVHANLATDHEQVFFGAFAVGIDPRGDPLFCQVPRPLLINDTADDNLNPPSGVWELSTWLYRAYSAHGAPHKFQTTMVKAPHGYNQEQREVAYAWMLQWAGADASDFREGDFAIEKEQDTWCTAGGNVYRESGSRSPHDLVLEHLENHQPVQEITKTDLQSSIREILCLEDSAAAPHMEVVKTRTVLLDPTANDGGATHSASLRAGPTLRVTAVKITPEKGIVLPGVWLESRQKHQSGRVIVYLNDRGKNAIIEEKAIVEPLLEAGHRIFAVDLRGMGETSPSQEGKFWDFLAGRPIFGQRVADIRAVVKYMSRSATEGQSIFVWAGGMSAVYAALAAVMEDDISGMVLERPLLTFEQVVTTKVPAYRHEVILPGVLERFDLPQIYQVLCPMKITLVNPLRGDKSLASKDQVEHALRQAAQEYVRLGNPGNWSVHAQVNDRARTQAILGRVGLAPPKGQGDGGASPTLHTD